MYEHTKKYDILTAAVDGISSSYSIVHYLLATEVWVLHREHRFQDNGAADEESQTTAAIPFNPFLMPKLRNITFIVLQEPLTLALGDPFVNCYPKRSGDIHLLS